MSKTPKPFIFPKLPKNLRFSKVAGPGPAGMMSAVATPLKPKIAPRIRPSKTMKAPAPQKHAPKKITTEGAFPRLKKPTFI